MGWVPGATKPGWVGWAPGATKPGWVGWVPGATKPGWAGWVGWVPGATKPGWALDCSERSRAESVGSGDAHGELIIASSISVLY